MWDAQYAQYLSTCTKNSNPDSNSVLTSNLCINTNLQLLVMENILYSIPSITGGTVKNKNDITFLDSSNDSRITYSRFFPGSGPKMSEIEL